MPVASKPTKRFLSSILILFVFFPGAVVGASSPPVAPFATAPYIGGSGGGDHSTSTVMSLRSLPAVLHSFTVEQQGQARLLRWRVSGEGSESFHVERSFDGQNFASIDDSPITGNLPEKHLYTFIDRDPLAGGVYYRLRIREADGQHRYSDIRFLSVKSSDWGFTVPNNPGDPERIALLLRGLPHRESLDVQVHSLTGQSVLRTAATSHAANLSLDLPAGFPRGTYVLTVVRSDGSVRSRLVPLFR